MTIEENDADKDTWVVSIHHNVVISKANAFNNFDQYVENLRKEFNAAMTKTLYSVTLSTS